MFYWKTFDPGIHMAGWMLLDTHHPSKHRCGPSTPPHDICTPWWPWPRGWTMHQHTTKTAKEQLKEHSKVQGNYLASKSELLWDMLEQVWSMEAPPSNMHDPQSSTNLQVPDTTGHPRGSYYNALMGKSCFWLHKGNLHNIKLRVLMLWLMVYSPILCWYSFSFNIQSRLSKVHRVKKVYPNASRSSKRHPLWRKATVIPNLASCILQQQFFFLSQRE